MKSSMPSWLTLKNSISNPTTLLVIVAFGIFLPVCSRSQTLFSYGSNQVTAEEFNHAYQKNNRDTGVNRLSIDDYLDLYIRFKLKVQAARDAGLDTTAAQKAELKSFRYQLAENYIREDASINLLVDEAFRRSLKDVHISHLFIPVNRDAPEDSIEIAQRQINSAYERLKSGEPLEKVAASFTYNRLGYITAFVLPYNFESIAYATPLHGYSAPFQNQSGFHILRVDSERKAVGKIRAAQILLAYPPDVTEAGKKDIANRADSIYNALKNGGDFAAMAKQFSDDHLTFYTGGEMPAFGVGQYDTAFENAAFALANDGDISPPVKTRFGFHIIRRIQRIPVIEDESNKEWKEVIRERVLQSDRMQVAHDKLIASIRNIISKDANTEDMSSDSAVLDYYRNHLENYNAEFAGQLKEFREGNLLFTIMQQKVWDAAANDSAGLRGFYEKNAQRYYWDNSADALIVTCLVPDSLNQVRRSIEENYHSWRDLVENYNSLVQVDSGRFDLSQIPVVDRTNFQDGLLTAPVINEPDSSRTFAYIIKLYPGRTGKSYNDARGTVINDYQNLLEENWITELKKKYPVKINRKVLEKIRQSPSPRRK